MCHIQGRFLRGPGPPDVQDLPCLEHQLHPRHALHCVGTRGTRNEIVENPVKVETEIVAVNVKGPLKRTLKPLKRSQRTTSTRCSKRGQTSRIFTTCRRRSKERRRRVREVAPVTSDTIDKSTARFAGAIESWGVRRRSFQKALEEALTAGPDWSLAGRR